MSVRTLPDVPGGGSGARNHPLLRITSRQSREPLTHSQPSRRPPVAGMTAYSPLPAGRFFPLSTIHSLDSELWLLLERTSIRGHRNPYISMSTRQSKNFSGSFRAGWLLASSVHLLRLGFFVGNTRTDTKPLPLLTQHSCWHPFSRTGFYKEKGGRRTMILDPREGENRTDTEWECWVCRRAGMY